VSARDAAKCRAALAAALALVTGTVSGVWGCGAARASEPLEVQLQLQGDEPAAGSPQAPVTMVEFTDYQCPYCRRFQAEVWPRLQRDYIAHGQLRFIVLDLPLEFHPAALPAAEAAHCAAEQGAFWPMHAALLASGSDLSAADLEQHVRALGLDLGRFRTCMASGKYAALIVRNAGEAQALGLRGTPAFIIGRLEHAELHGQVLMGALPYADFAAADRHALGQHARSAAPGAGVTAVAAGRSRPPRAAAADTAAPAAGPSPRS
jgi:protein-disulfide isomerase